MTRGYWTGNAFIVPDSLTLDLHCVNGTRSHSGQVPRSLSSKVLYHFNKYLCLLLFTVVTGALTNVVFNVNRWARTGDFTLLFLKICKIWAKTTILQ